VGNTLLAGRAAGTVLGVRVVTLAVGCRIGRKGVLAGVLDFLAPTASPGSDVVTGGVVRNDEPDAVDICGLGRRGLELSCPWPIVLEKPGRCRLRVSIAGFRGGWRVSAVCPGTDDSADEAAELSPRAVLFMPLMLLATFIRVAAVIVRPGTGSCFAFSDLVTSGDAIVLSLGGLLLAGLVDVFCPGCRATCSPSLDVCTILAMRADVCLSWREWRQVTSRHVTSQWFLAYVRTARVSHMSRWLWYATGTVENSEDKCSELYSFKRGFKHTTGRFTAC